jgi:peptide-methionine (S)-S-oxide reductase
LTASAAAALGRNAELAALLPEAAAEERQKALGMAVINGHREAARLCLEAGADVDGFLPVHAHSTPLHQAVANDDMPMMELLLARGARSDIPDTMWNSTALGWAKYMGKRKAEAVLQDAPRAWTGASIHSHPVDPAAELRPPRG